MLPHTFRNPGLPLSLFGLPVLLMALALAAQTYFTCKRGYVYCGRTQTVEKKKEPSKYRIWFCIQVSGVLFFLLLATFPFWL